MRLNVAIAAYDRRDLLRQLKAMILLSDVDERGQYMTYVRGSHRAFHPHERCLEFTADRNPGSIWGTDLRRARSPALHSDAAPALRPFLDARPKWRRGREKRRRPTWAESLEDPSLWL